MYSFSSEWAPAAKGRVGFGGNSRGRAVAFKVDSDRGRLVQELQCLKALADGGRDLVVEALCVVGWPDGGHALVLERGLFNLRHFLQPANYASPSTSPSPGSVLQASASASPSIGYNPSKAASTSRSS